MSWEMKRTSCSRRSVRSTMPLPVPGEPFLAMLADIFLGDGGGLLVIPDQLLLIIGIAGPLELRPLFSGQAWTGRCEACPGNRSGRRWKHAANRAVR